MLHCNGLCMRVQLALTGLLTLSAHAREGYSSHFVCLFWIVEKAPFSGLKLTSIHSR